jgi:hypothetical protein
MTTFRLVAGVRAARDEKKIKILAGSTIFKSRIDKSNKALRRSF